MTSSCAADSVAILGSHTPRRCGIATFTADLASAVQASSASIQCSVVAVNDEGSSYDYPECVAHEIPEASLASYRRAADYLNEREFSVLSLQHEYEMFGGPAGAHVLTLLRDLRLPVVTTLHSVLDDPTPAQRVVMDELCAHSERLVVMSPHGAEVLSRVHGVPASKIDVIPHGIPALPDPQVSREQLGLTGKRVLLSFGLLSPEKGIEYVIDSLVELVKEHPDVVYIVLGATHPQEKAKNGEAYREMLEARTQLLELGEHVVFHDRFVSPVALTRFLAAADVYVAPNLDERQTTSGTLAYAVGSGKAVVSTRFRYAEELLADERGLLVPARDSDALAQAIGGLLSDDQRKAELEQRAASLGEGMHWPVVAEAYLESFARARANYLGRGRSRISDWAPSVHAALPAMNLSHLLTLTDDTGILQQATYAVPRYEEGYCVDDNARALLTVTLLDASRTDVPAPVRNLATRYLAFVRHALDHETGRFRNFMNYERVWTERVGSEESHGRCLWALGTVIARTQVVAHRALASELFDWALPAVLTFTSPRAWAYTLLGIGELARTRRASALVEGAGKELGQRLMELYQRSHRGNWLWFEDTLGTCNARIPQALIATGSWLGDDEMITIGLRALDWLSRVQITEDGVFAPVGSSHLHVQQGNAIFDQLPVEACSMVGACLEAHRVTAERQWLSRSRQAFDWYLGQNQLQQPLHDPTTGGCRDGLHADRVNQNQGAEATLSFLMALHEMRQSERRLGVLTPRLTLVPKPRAGASA